MEILRNYFWIKMCAVVMLVICTVARVDAVITYDGEPVDDEDVGIFMSIARTPSGVEDLYEILEEAGVDFTKIGFRPEAQGLEEPESEGRSYLGCILDNGGRIVRAGGNVALSVCVPTAVLVATRLTCDGVMTFIPLLLPRAGGRIAQAAADMAFLEHASAMSSYVEEGVQVGVNPLLYSSIGGTTGRRNDEVESVEALRRSLRMNSDSDFSDDEGGGVEMAPLRSSVCVGADFDSDLASISDSDFSDDEDIEAVPPGLSAGMEDEGDGFEVMELPMPETPEEVAIYLKLMHLIKTDVDRVGGVGTELIPSLRTRVWRGAQYSGQLALLVAEPLAFQFVVGSLGLGRIAVGLLHKPIAGYVYATEAASAGLAAGSVTRYLPGSGGVIRRLAGGLARAEFYQKMPNLVSGITHVAPTIYTTGKAICKAGKGLVTGVASWFKWGGSGDPEAGNS